MITYSWQDFEKVHNAILIIHGIISYLEIGENVVNISPHVLALQRLSNIESLRMETVLYIPW